jgi:hypothetical protein
MVSLREPPFLRLAYRSLRCLYVVAALGVGRVERERNPPTINPT